MAGGRVEVRAGDGSTLVVEVDGQPGADALLLHGSLESPRSFDRLRAASAWSGRWLSPALRAHGPDPAPLPPDYSIDTEVDDALAVLDALDVERACCIGHSTGGAVALALALRAPQRVSSLTLIEPTLLGLLGSADFERFAGEAAPVLAAADQADHEAALRGMMTVIGGEVWAALPAAVQDKVVRGRSGFGPVIGPVVRSLFAYRAGPEQVVDLRVPTVLVYGEHGPWIESAIAASFARLRPDLEQVHVPGAGHAVHVDRPAVVAAAFERLAGIGG